MTTPLRVLAVGETWRGSTARSFCDALRDVDDMVVDVVAEDAFFPAHVQLWKRLLARIVRPVARARMNRLLRRRISRAHPDVLLVFKGGQIVGSTLDAASSSGVHTVNFFPDCSPQAHGKRLAASIGKYDVVVSTKSFHAEVWKTVYGYDNPCRFLSHGYDPEVHLWNEPPSGTRCDLALCATARSEYFELALSLAQSPDIAVLEVVIAGWGWESFRSRLPSHWRFPGLIAGRSYGEFMREAKICIAPLQTRMVVEGREQPGDQDSTRTYELAAMYTFFLHRRTPFVKAVYDEATEVPMWNDSTELVTLIRRWLPDEPGRKRLAEAAHRRAVPEYSIERRAAQLAGLLREVVAGDMQPGIVEP